MLQLYCCLLQKGKLAWLSCQRYLSDQSNLQSKWTRRLKVKTLNEVVSCVSPGQFGAANRARSACCSDNLRSRRPWLKSFIRLNIVRKIPIGQKENGLFFNSCIFSYRRGGNIAMSVFQISCSPSWHMFELSEQSGLMGRITVPNPSATSAPRTETLIHRYYYTAVKPLKQRQALRLKSTC